MQKIYFRQLIVAMFALLCSVTASAKFEVGGIYYNVTSEADLTVEVTYKAASRGRNYRDSIIVIPSKKPSVIFSTSFTIRDK